MKKRPFHYLPMLGIFAFLLFGLYNCPPQPRPGSADQFVFSTFEPGQEVFFRAAEDGSAVTELTRLSAGSDQCVASVAFSPQKDKFLYVISKDRGFCINETAGQTDLFEIWLGEMNADFELVSSRRLATGKYPAWSPNGEQVLFYHGGIQLIKADGTGGRTVVPREEGPEGLFAWSPDGTRIAYQASLQGSEVAQFFVKELETGQTLALGQGLRQTHRNQAPIWSPDGLQVGFLAGTYDPNPDNPSDFIYRDLFLAQTDGSGTTNLTQNEIDVVDASWSPNGDQLLYQAEENGDNMWYGDELYVVDLPDGLIRNISNHPSFDGGAYWHPRGEKVFFSSSRTGTPDIFAVMADGTGLVNLTKTDWPDSYITISPASYRIAFLSSPGEDQPREVFIMQEDGSGMKQISQAEGRLHRIYDWLVPEDTRLRPVPEVSMR